MWSPCGGIPMYRVPLWLLNYAARQDTNGCGAAQEIYQQINKIEPNGAERWRDRPGPPDLVWTIKIRRNLMENSSRKASLMKRRRSNSGLGILIKWLPIRIRDNITNLRVFTGRDSSTYKKHNPRGIFERSRKEKPRQPNQWEWN